MLPLLLMRVGDGVAQAATVAGYDYDTRKKKQQRRRVIIDGLTYFVTPEEEAELLNKLIRSLERKVEVKQPVAAKPKQERRLPKPETVARLKIHLALLNDELRLSREAELHLDRTIALRQRAIEQLYEEDAIALILAVA